MDNSDSVGEQEISTFLKELVTAATTTPSSSHGHGSHHHHHPHHHPHHHAGHALSGLAHAHSSSVSGVSAGTSSSSALHQNNHIAHARSIMYDAVWAIEERACSRRSLSTRDTFVEGRLRDTVNDLIKGPSSGQGQVDLAIDLVEAILPLEYTDRSAKFPRICRTLLVLMKSGSESSAKRAAGIFGKALLLAESPNKNDEAAKVVREAVLSEINDMCDWLQNQLHARTQARGSTANSLAVMLACETIAINQPRYIASARSKIMSLAVATCGSSDLTVRQAAFSCLCTLFNTSGSMTTKGQDLSHEPQRLVEDALKNLRSGNTSDALHLSAVLSLKALLSRRGGANLDKVKLQNISVGVLAVHKSTKSATVRLAICDAIPVIAKADPTPKTRMITYIAALVDPVRNLRDLTSKAKELENLAAFIREFGYDVLDAPNKVNVESIVTNLLTKSSAPHRECWQVIAAITATCGNTPNDQKFLKAVADKCVPSLHRVPLSHNLLDVVQSVADSVDELREPLRAAIKNLIDRNLRLVTLHEDAISSATPTPPHTPRARSTSFFGSIFSRDSSPRDGTNGADGGSASGAPNSGGASGGSGSGQTITPDEIDCTLAALANRPIANVLESAEEIRGNVLHLMRHPLLQVRTACSRLVVTVVGKCHKQLKTQQTAIENELLGRGFAPESVNAAIAAVAAHSANAPPQANSIQPHISTAPPYGLSASMQGAIAANHQARHLLVGILEAVLRNSLLETESQLRLLQMELLYQEDITELLSPCLSQLLCFLNDRFRIREVVLKIVMKLATNKNDFPRVAEEFSSIIQGCALTLEHTTDQRVLVKQIADLIAFTVTGLQVMGPFVHRLMISVKDKLEKETSNLGEVTLVSLIKVIEEFAIMIEKEIVTTTAAESEATTPRGPGTPLHASQQQQQVQQQQRHLVRVSSSNRIPGRGGTTPPSPQSPATAGTTSFSATGKASHHQQSQQQSQAASNAAAVVQQFVSDVDLLLPTMTSIICGKGTPAMQGAALKALHQLLIVSPDVKISVGDRVLLVDSLASAFMSSNSVTTRLLISTLLGQIGATAPSVQIEEVGDATEPGVKERRADVDNETQDFGEIVYHAITSALDDTIHESLLTVTMRTLLQLVKNTNASVVRGLSAMRSIATLVKNFEGQPTIQAELLLTLSALVSIRRDQAIAMLSEIIILLKQCWNPLDHSLFNAVLEVVEKLDVGTSLGPTQIDDEWPWLFPKLIDAAVCDNTPTASIAAKVVEVFKDCTKLSVGSVQYVVPCLTNFVGQTEKPNSLRCSAASTVVNIVCEQHLERHLPPLLHALRRIGRHVTTDPTLAAQFSASVENSLHRLSATFLNARTTVRNILNECSLRLEGDRTIPSGHHSSSGLFRNANSAGQLQASTNSLADYDNHTSEANDHKNMGTILSHVEGALMTKNVSWKRWFNEFQRLLFVCSPHFAFRMCVQLYDKNERLRRQLLNPSFFCFIRSVDSDEQRAHVGEVLRRALASSEAEVVATCLGLSDYLERCDQVTLQSQVASPTSAHGPRVGSGLLEEGSFMSARSQDISPAVSAGGGGGGGGMMQRKQQMQNMSSLFSSVGPGGVPGIGVSVSASTDFNFDTPPLPSTATTTNNNLSVHDDDAFGSGYETPDSAGPTTIAEAIQFAKRYGHVHGLKHEQGSPNAWVPVAFSPQREKRYDLIPLKHLCRAAILNKMHTKAVRYMELMLQSGSNNEENVEQLAQLYNSIGMQSSVVGLYESVDFKPTSLSYELRQWWQDANKAYWGDIQSVNNAAGGSSSPTTMSREGSQAMTAEYHNNHDLHDEVGSPLLPSSAKMTPRHSSSSMLICHPHHGQLRQASSPNTAHRISNLNAAWEGYVRTYSLCGSWQQTIDAAHQYQSTSTSNDGQMTHAIASSAAIAGWMLQDWDEMKSCVRQLDESGLMFVLTSVIVLREGDSKQLHQCIRSGRQFLDETLRAMLPLGYHQAYEAITLLQHLREVEEAHVYRVSNAARKEKLRNLWYERLTNLKNDALSKLISLAIHSLVVKPRDMAKSWLYFCESIRPSHADLANWAMDQLQQDPLRSPGGSSSAFTSGCNSPMVQGLSVTVGGASSNLLDLTGSLSGSVSANPNAALLSNNSFGTSSGIIDRGSFANKKLLRIGRCTHMWEEGEKEAAIKDLEVCLNSDLRRTANEFAIPSMDPNNDEVCAAWMRLGRWKLERGGFWVVSRRGEILKHFLQAVHCCPDEYQPWHEWGLMNYRVQQRCKDLSTEDRKQFIIKAHHGFTAAICKSSTQVKALQDVLRLMQLWIQYDGAQHLSNEHIHDAIQRIPVIFWVDVVPQLIAHLGHEDVGVRTVVCSVLQLVCEEHPQAAFFSLTVPILSESGTEQQRLRAKLAKQLLDASSHQTLVRNVKTVAQLLINVAALPVENLREMVGNVLRPLADSEEPTTPHLVPAVKHIMHFVDRNAAAFETVGPVNTHLNTLILQCQSSRERAVAFCRKLYSEIESHVNHIKVVKLSCTAPSLQNVKDFGICVPGEYSATNKEYPHIMFFHERLSVIPSKHRPRKLALTGSDGEVTAYCLKGNEDCRIDERVMQLFWLVNSLMSTSSSSSQQHTNNPLRITRFHVTPLSSKVGMLGWVENTETMHQVIARNREKVGEATEHEIQILNEMVPTREFQTLSNIQKVELFECVHQQTHSSDVAHNMWQRSITAEGWLERRTTYTQSLALMSMVGYVLGLGDRHMGNLLMNIKSGQIIHIDFGDCFDIARLRSVFPETVPFRLTRMLTKAMEVFGVGGEFKSTSTKSMEILRRNRDSIVALLSAFIYDPTVNSRVIEKIGSPEDVVERMRCKLEGIEYIDARAPPKSFGSSSSLSAPSSPTATTKNAGTHHTKLGGGGFASSNALPCRPDITFFRTTCDKEVIRCGERRIQPVAEQVQNLIDEAVSLENHCELFAGWCPLW